jgi:chorismate dehydratase
MIKLSIVSYLNSLPFLHGLQNSPIAEQLEISEDAPAVCAEKVMNGTADIGLIPVAVLPLLSTYQIVSNYCIGCNGEVYSVLLLSDVPLQDITTIKLDYQSRTSVQLVKILAKHYWRITPSWEAASAGFEKDINESTAGVVIGDRAMAERKNHKYIYDLGEAWQQMTGLPFVFAVWISTRPVSDELLHGLNIAFAQGLKAIPTLAEKAAVTFSNSSEIRKYLEEYIQYSFGEQQKEAMDLFLKFLKDTDNEK